MNKFSSSKDPKMVVTSNTNDEFSFPIMPNPLASFMLTSSSSSSSSLWRISSRVFHHHEEEGEENRGENNEMEVRSMCEGHYSPMKGEIEWSSCQGEELAIEDRMDCLWEDFNEEDHHHYHHNVIRSNRQELPMQRKPRMSSRRSSKMLVMAKLLRGLDSIRKSAQLKIMKARS